MTIALGIEIAHAKLPLHPLRLPPFGCGERESISFRSISPRPLWGRGAGGEGCWASKLLACFPKTSRLKAETSNIPRDSLVHIGEPVEFEYEFRCFVSLNRVNAISAYVYDGHIVSDYDSFPSVPKAQLDLVRSFAKSVLDHPDVAAPPAFTLDIGLIRGRGWAVVECNECWASGIYACDPIRVLETLVSSVVEADAMDSSAWDFRQHYAKACPNIAG